MRFGETLLAELVPEFRLHYIDYEKLKRALEAEPGTADELAALIHELQTDYGLENFF